MTWGSGQPPELSREVVHGGFVELPAPRRHHPPRVRSRIYGEAHRFAHDGANGMPCGVIHDNTGGGGLQTRRLHHSCICPRSHRRQ